MPAPPPPTVEADAGGLRGEVLIAAPVARVFPYVCDLRNMPAWWPEHRVYRRVVGDGGPGTLYAMLYQPTPIPVLAASLVEAIEPGAFFAYYAGYPGVGFRIEARFAAAPALPGTRLELTFFSFALPPPPWGTVTAAGLSRALGRLSHILGE